MDENLIEEMNRIRAMCPHESYTEECAGCEDRAAAVREHVKKWSDYYGMLDF